VQDLTLSCFDQLIQTPPGAGARVSLMIMNVGHNGNQMHRKDVHTFGNFAVKNEM
jgi:hypothetical protein